MPTTNAPSVPSQPAGHPTDLTLGDADPTIADLDDVYLDGTLVLVGCGKAKRDPEDPTDLHLATVEPGEPIRRHSQETGPAWNARDLYTSTYFGAKRDFAEVVTPWTRSNENGAAGWGILSAEHHVLMPYEPVTPYDTSIDDIGDDPSVAEDRVGPEYAKAGSRRRPDGREVVTEMDAWASQVAYSLMRWIASYRDQGARRWECEADTLLVLAGQDYIDPLRERGVFEYGIDRMCGDPNYITAGFPLEVRYLFETIDAGGNGEQMAWLSDAVGRIEDSLPDGEGQTTEQEGLGAWSADRRRCAVCSIPAADLAGDETLDTYQDGVYCPDHYPIGDCARCDAPTHRTAKFGTYPLCGDCRSERGGMTDDQLPEDDPNGEQADLESGWSG